MRIRSRAAAKRQTVLPPDLDVDWARRVAGAIRCFMTAARNYRPGTLDRPLILLRPETGEGAGKQDDHGWSVYARGVAVHRVPSTHHTMVHGEGASRVAALIAEHERSCPERAYPVPSLGETNYV